MDSSCTRATCAGRLANVIALERAQGRLVLSFAKHARRGVPMTLLSFLLALAWLYGLGHVGP